VGQRYSLKRIAERLTRERVPTHGTKLRRKTASGVWHVECVRKLLLNENYIGTLYYGKRQRIAGKGNPDKKTHWRAVPREEWIPISVPPIIDQMTFQAAQVQLARNAQTSRRNRKYEQLFIGERLRCGQCGRGMSGYQNGQGVRAYRCTRHPYQAQDVPHTRRALAALPVETAVWRAVETALRNPALIAQELQRRQQGRGQSRRTLTGRGVCLRGSWRSARRSLSAGRRRILGTPSI
jgi:site-specific DNA recombinase